MRDVRALTILLPLLTLLAGPAALAAAENWPQWRGPGGQGVSSETQLPTEWGPDNNIVWKVAFPATATRRRWSRGDRIYLTAVVEGDVVPGQRAVNHRHGRSSTGSTPTASPPTTSTHSWSLALDATSGRRCGTARRTKARSTTRGTVEAPLRDRRRDRRRGWSTRTLGQRASTPTTSAASSSGRYETPFPTLGLGAGTSPVLYEILVIIQRDEDNGETRPSWRTTSTPARRPGTRSGRADHVVDTGARDDRRPHRAGDERRRVHHCLRPATGKELWRTTGVDSNAIHTPLVGHGLVIVTAGYPVKKVIAIRPGAVSDGPARRVGYSQRHRLCPLESPLWRLSLSLHRQRDCDLPGSKDRCGQVQRRADSRAGALHGIAGRLRGPGRDDERGGRHLHAQGRADARDRPNQLGRRTGLLIAGNRQRADLRPSGEALVRDRKVAPQALTAAPVFQSCRTSIHPPCRAATCPRNGRRGRALCT